MNILLVYPECPDNFWSFKHVLKYISKKSVYPPLGILTVASFLPSEWNLKLLDLNVEKMKKKNIQWADLVFISAMSVQKESVQKIIEKCKAKGVRIVAGGPLFTTNSEDYEDVDYLILNEAEITLPQFLDDLAKGKPRHIYQTEEWADIKKTPLPMWELVNMRKYASMNIQYSRGCPFDCEFCNITELYGRIPRIKTREQLIAEFNILYDRGWRGSLFIVDDNFIGNRIRLKKEILPAIIEWMEEKKYPFVLSTEVSVDLADDELLMDLMRKAGFVSVFVGIETPNEESLAECNKSQNKNRNLIECVRKIQKHGMQVQGGFIVGFDNDPVSIFDNIINFIQESGIVSAMVGLLNAPRGTKLYQRLMKEGRVLKDSTGSNTDYSINFIPRMDPDELVNGYKNIVSTIYSPKYYYQRVKTFISNYRPPECETTRFGFISAIALLKTMFTIGLIGEERFEYWKLFIWSLFKHPKLFPLAMTLSVYGLHYRKSFRKSYKLT